MNSDNQFSPAYKWYALFVLYLGYVVNFVDRQILSILLESIRQDLQFNDLQLGLLGGLAFAIFYATLGIPIAMLADRKNRVKILSAAMVVWSIMTASVVWQTTSSLLLARIGVGVGEAGASPPSHSLISDYFPSSSRHCFVNLLVGDTGWLVYRHNSGRLGADELGWRNTFFLVGIPGVLVALLVLLTLREPPRGMSDREQNLQLKQTRTIPKKLARQAGRL